MIEGSSRTRCISRNYSIGFLDVKISIVIHSLEQSPEDGGGQISVEQFPMQMTRQGRFLPSGTGRIMRTQTGLLWSESEKRFGPGGIGYFRCKIVTAVGRRSVAGGANCRLIEAEVT